MVVLKKLVQPFFYVFKEVILIKKFKLFFLIFVTSTLLSSSIHVFSKNIDKNDNISLWVGDSRTVLIYQDLNMKTLKSKKYRDKAKIESYKGRRHLMLKYRDCYAARGVGYDYFADAMKKVEKVVKEKGCQNIVLSSSVNDIYNTNLNSFYSYLYNKKVCATPEKLAKKYWILYKKIIRKYPEDHFYLMSINPVYTPLYYRGNSVNNNKIVRFNKKLKSLINQSSYKNVSYVNTYKNVFKKQGLIHKKSAYRYAAKYRRMPVRYMKESSCFQLHYSTEVDKQIYQYVERPFQVLCKLKKLI